MIKPMIAGNLRDIKLPKRKFKQLHYLLLKQNINQFLATTKVRGTFTPVSLYKGPNLDDYADQY